MSDNISVLGAAAAVIIIIKRRRRRREQRSNRSIWCRQWLADRRSDRGIGYFIVKELMPAEAAGFHGFLRMTPEVFNELLEIINPRLQKIDTFMRDSISTHDILVATLRFLASGKVLLTLFNDVR
jgi:hypothetical protein